MLGAPRRTRADRAYDIVSFDVPVSAGPATASRPPSDRGGMQCARRDRQSIEHVVAALAHACLECRLEPLLRRQALERRATESAGGGADRGAGAWRSGGCADRGAARRPDQPADGRADSGLLRGAAGGAERQLAALRLIPRNSARTGIVVRIDGWPVAAHGRTSADRERDDKEASARVCPHDAKSQQVAYHRVGGKRSHARIILPTGASSTFPAGSTKGTSASSTRIGAPGATSRMRRHARWSSLIHSSSSTVDAARSRVRHVRAERLGRTADGSARQS